MTKPRTEIHDILTEMLGSSNVYFQPPETAKMKYPCIVYSVSSMDSFYADDGSYLDYDTYTITYITKDPDSAIPRRLLRLPMTSYDRHFVSDNLHHTVILMKVY